MRLPHYRKRAKLNLSPKHHHASRLLFASFGHFAYSPDSLLHLEASLDSLIINFGVTDPDGDCLVKFSTRKGVHLINSTRQDTSVFEDSCTASHRVCLACACLTIAENSAVVTIND